ncbi:MAG TPA: hypothetical protein PLX35_05580 [Cyclobacteriaceae bacterium]|nr:hypothetical protein [Cyclobacteriaceae bacterium]
MSHAFMREGDAESLDEIRPSVHALCMFLTRENNGIAIVERRVMNDGQGRILHVMSNGLTYTKDDRGRWMVYSE